MIDAIRRRQIDESMNDIKNFNSMVFNLERKNIELQPENVLPYTQINPDAIAATKTSVQELYLLIEKKRAAVTNAGHTVVGRPTHTAETAEASIFEDVRQRYNGVVKQILTDINTQPAQTSHQRIDSLKSILQVTSHLPNKYSQAINAMLRSANPQVIVAYVPRLIAAMVFYQIINSQLPGNHLAEIDQSEVTRGIATFLNSNPNIKQIYDHNQIPTDNFNVGSSGNFPPRPPPPPPPPPPGGGFPPGAPPGAPPGGGNDDDDDDDDDDDGRRSLSPTEPFEGRRLWGFFRRPQAGTGSAAEVMPAGQEGQVAEEEPLQQGVVAMPSAPPQADPRGLLQRLPRLPISMWAAQAEPERYDIHTAREDQAMRDVQTGEEPAEITPEQEELANTSSEVMTTRLKDRSDWIVQHLGKAVEEAGRTGGDIVKVAVDGTVRGVQQVVQIPLEIARVISRNPDAFAGALMTFFWHEALKAVLPEVPDLFTDPIAQTQRTIETMENTGWLESVWLAINPYARERKEYEMAARHVDLLDLTERLSPSVKHFMNAFFKKLVPTVAGAVAGGENIMQIMYAIYQMSSLTSALKFAAATAVANTATTAMGGLPASAMMASASSAIPGMMGAMPSLMGATATTAAAALAPVATAVARRMRKKSPKPLALTQQAQTQAAVAQEGQSDPRPVSVAAAAAASPQSWPKPPPQKQRVSARRGYPQVVGEGRLETPESLHLQPKAKAKARAKGGTKPRARKIELTKPIIPYHDIMNDGYYMK